MGEEASSNCICFELWRDKITGKKPVDAIKDKSVDAKNVRYLYAAYELEGGQEEQQIKSGPWRLLISIEHLLFSTIWRMDQNMDSSDKSFRLFLLRKLVD